MGAQGQSYPQDLRSLSSLQDVAEGEASEMSAPRITPVGGCYARPVTVNARTSRWENSGGHAMAERCVELRQGGLVKLAKNCLPFLEKEELGP